PSSFQNTAYTALKPLDGAHYSPAFFYEKSAVVSSSRANCEKFISASKGNRPVIGDDASYAALGEYAKAPTHIVVNMPRAIDAIRSFFYYGAERSDDYTSVTVDRDIMPLADPFKNYGTLHIAMGMEKNRTGRLVLTGKKP
ncbi:MAG: hypothetical protein ACRCUT_01330, partial [Spirochaetota bacterium]